MSVAGFDQLLKVAGQHQLFDCSPDDAERCLERNPVHHGGARGLRVELVDVPEPSERSPDLLVHETLRCLHEGDPARHPQRHPEVPGAPGHLLAQRDEPSCYPGHRFLAGPRHRVLVGINASGEVEQLGLVHAGARDALEVNGHASGHGRRERKKDDGRQHKNAEQCEGQPLPPGWKVGAVGLGQGGGKGRADEEEDAEHQKGDLQFALIAAGAVAGLGGADHSVRRCAQVGSEQGTWQGADQGGGKDADGTPSVGRGRRGVWTIPAPGVLGRRLSPQRLGAAVVNGPRVFTVSPR